MSEQTKTIKEQLLDIVEDICDNYCKYPEQWHGDREELYESETCRNCPLNKINGPI